MAPPRIERRKRIVVDRDLQLRLISRISLAFVGSLVVFLALNLGGPVLLGAIGGVPGWGVGTFLFRLRFLAAFVALPLLSGVLVLFAVGVRATFGVAGPLYRFNQVFRDLGALRIPRGVRIRKDDALQGSAALFDVSLVALHEHVERLQALGSSTLSELEARLEADPHFEGPLRELRLRLHALAEETARFQLLPRAPYPEPPPAAPAPVEPPRADAKPQEPLEEPVAPDSAVR